MSNGQLTNLAPIYSGHNLRADAATSWLRLCNYFGREIRLSDSYRPLSVQRNIFLARYIPQAEGGGYYGDVKPYQGVRYVRLKGFATAAVPGTSNHGWGLALDLKDGVNEARGEVWNWLNRYAHLFGWVNPDWAKKKDFYEPWHWEYVSAQDTKKNEPLEGVVSGQNKTKEWDEVASKDEIKQALMEVLGSTDIAGAVLNRDLGGKGRPDDIVWYILKATLNAVNQVSAQQVAILSKLEEKGVDPAVIQSAIKESMTNFEITLKAGE